MWCLTPEITDEMTKKIQTHRNFEQIPGAISRKSGI